MGTDENEMVGGLLKKEIERLLEPLDDLERTVLTLSYGLANDIEPMDAAEVAAQMNVSKDVVDRVVRDAMNKLRHPKS